MFTETKLRRGMILITIRVGNVKILAMGGKIHVSPPFLFSHLPLSHAITSLKVLLLVGAVITGEWSVVGLSVLAHMHAPPAG